MEGGEPGLGDIAASLTEKSGIGDAKGDIFRGMRNGMEKNRRRQTVCDDDWIWRKHQWGFWQNRGSLVAFLHEFRPERLFCRVLFIEDQKASQRSRIPKRFSDERLNKALVLVRWTKTKSHKLLIVSKCNNNDNGGRQHPLANGHWEDIRFAPKTLKFQCQWTPRQARWLFSVSFLLKILLVLYKCANFSTPRL